MKRIISSLLVLILAVLSLTGCTMNKKEVLNIGGAEISSGTYAYFLNEAFMYPAGNGVSEQEQALDLCKEYVGVNSLFDNGGYRLSSATRKNISVEANALWRIYEQYYTEIGVNKQEFVRAAEYEAKKEELLKIYYGTDGIYPVSEADLKAYFEQNFVVFQSINGYLTKTDEHGNSVNMSEEEANALRNQFKSMADRVNGGEPIETVSSDYLASQSGSQQPSAEDDSLSAVVLQKGDASYPEGFFDQIAAMKNGEVKTVEIDQYIFLVKRIDAFEQDSTYFSDSEIACLSAMKSNDLKNIISEETSKYEIKQKKSAMKSCLKKIEKRRGKTKSSETINTTAAQ